jgi:hypothetical protein
MAAGLGFKTFNTGDVLSAADVNGYLMQGILVFASATARDAAITSPQEGQFAFLKDTNVTTYYTGSAWANVDTTGMTNPMTTTGDVIYSSSGSTPARLGIGTAGQVLQVNSGATAPEWATPAAGGSGFSVVKAATTFTNVANTGTTFDSLFTSSYKYYQVQLYMVGAATGTDDFELQFLYSGTVEDTLYYGSSLYSDSVVGVEAQTANGSAFKMTNSMGPTDNGLRGVLNFTNVGTGVSERGAFYGQIFVPASGTKNIAFSGYCYQDRAITGFRLKSSTSNITGTITVYGLGN